MSVFSDFDIAAFSIYAGIILIYNAIVYGPFFGDYAWGPESLWAKRKNRINPLERWPQVIFKTGRPIVGLQTLRNSVQAAIFFSRTCFAIAVFCVFVDTEYSRRRVVFTAIALLFIIAFFHFVQVLRIFNHLNFIVVSRTGKAPQKSFLATETPPLVSIDATSPNGNTGSNPNPIEPRAAGSRLRSSSVPKRCAFESSSYQDLSRIARETKGHLEKKDDPEIMHHMRTSSDMPPRQNTTPIPSAQHFRSASDAIGATRPRSSSALGHGHSHHHHNTHSHHKGRFTADVYNFVSGHNIPVDDASPQSRTLFIEEEMSLEQHSKRVGALLQRSAVHFAVAMRIMLFCLPVMMAAFNATILIITSVLLVPVLIYYDRVMACPEDAFASDPGTEEAVTPGEEMQPLGDVEAGAGGGGG